jgi:beta-galactosidase
MPLLKTPCLALAALCAALLAIPTALRADTAAPMHTFAIGDTDFLLDGQRMQIRCGEIHAARVPREYWRQRLQMAKAMGLNTVCAYLFWNQVEQQQGHFDWSGQADSAEFCRIAQEVGLWVILRPGPYSCAEWEMGGTPWWFLAQGRDVKLRSRDPVYLDAARKYMREVGKQLAPLQVTHGGPILMVQVENEYGFYGNDTEYMGDIRQVLIDSGFDVPLFSCNPMDVMKNGLRADLFQAANFGKDPASNFKRLRELQPKGPLFCSEFYPGWFDTWGEPHHYGKTPQFLTDLTTMLDSDASFSIYMVHGGTTFGLWSGCDRPFKPDTSSYDYDAPISEAGWTTDKYFKVRALFSKYLLKGETLPDPPARNPVIAFAPVRAAQSAAVLDNLPAAIDDETPRNMEAYGQGYGCILYRTTIPAGAAAPLEASAIHDFGYILLDGMRIGVLDRRAAACRIQIPARSKDSTLDVLVEPMGRINFGPEMDDEKGLIAPVTLGGVPLRGWKVFSLPLDAKMVAGLKFKPAGTDTAPAFWKAIVSLPAAGDTFLDMRGWGKGVVWVNGRCLGRFWDIGPTQTAYAPGCWLHAGDNDVVILDVAGPSDPTVAGLDTPIIDQLRPSMDFAAAH